MVNAEGDGARVWAFGAELERITRTVQSFIASYKGPMTVRNGGSAPVARRRGSRNTMKQSRRRRTVR